MADEVSRRLVHASGTLVPVPYLVSQPPLSWTLPVVGSVSWEMTVWFVLAGTAIAAVLEALRLTGHLNLIVYDLLTREYEEHNPAGYALYAAGMAVAVAAFPPTIAIPALFMLTIGDPISGLLGSAGPEGVKGPVVLGVMFAVCFAVAYPFVGAAVAVAGALVATIADGVKPVVAGSVVDDNFTIPVGAGVAMWLGVAVLPVAPALLSLGA